MKVEELRRALRGMDEGADVYLQIADTTLGWADLLKVDVDEDGRLVLHDGSYQPEEED